MFLLRVRSSLLARAATASLCSIIAVGCASNPSSDLSYDVPAGWSYVDPAAAGRVLLDQPLVAWREFILPESPDTAAESIEWWTSFETGLAAAAAAEKPMLLWLMNGHPLGCT